MLTLGCDTFGLSVLVLPKRAIATYCGLRLEADTLAVLLRAHGAAEQALSVPTLECNLPLLCTLPGQPGESSLIQLVHGAFGRRKLPKHGAPERLEALARQEEERFTTYLAPLVGRLRADLERRTSAVTDLLGRDLPTYGFSAVQQALTRLESETVHLVSDRGPLALLHNQLEGRLSPQLRALERAKQRLRTLGARLVPPLRARWRSQALRLTQESTLLKLTLLLCRTLWHDEPIFQRHAAWLDEQRTRLQAIHESLEHRVQELAREQHEVADRDEVVERAGRGLCLTDALQDHGHSLEDYYRRAALSPETLAREVAGHMATATPLAVLAWLHTEVMRQGQRAVETLSVLGVLGELEAGRRRQLLTTCLQLAAVQMRIDPAAYVAHAFSPVMTRVCIVPGGQESPLAAWLHEVSAEAWDCVVRDTDEEVLFVTTGHRILPEALVGHRLIREVYERFPRKEWVQVLHCPEDDRDGGQPSLFTAQGGTAL